MDNAEFQAHTAKIEQLVERVSSLDDDAARTTALELMQSLMDLHGAVVSRIVEVLSNSGEAGRTSLAKLGSDPLVCGLLVLYGAHPVSLVDRVTQAIEGVQPQLRKHGGSVELLDLADSTVRVKIESTGSGCHSSADALMQAVEQAILEVAPEITKVNADGLAAASSGFVPLNMIQPVLLQPEIESAMKEDTKYEKSTA
jgi:Fe-S cluster biogenesis protein NfuA